LDTNLVRKDKDSRGRPIMQRAHVHEVGHLLGLEHVDVGKAHCPAGGNTNASACYGVADIDKNDVMGEGMQIRPRDAMPWRRAIQTLTGKGIVNSAADWQPKFVQHYPRTLAEAARGLSITVRPRR
jgi:hypothetical protein